MSLLDSNKTKTVIQLLKKYIKTFCEITKNLKRITKINVRATATDIGRATNQYYNTLTFRIHPARM